MSDTTVLVWRIANDGACDACKALNGKVQGDGWDNRDETLPVFDWQEPGPPPLHKNCQCILSRETASI